MTYNILLDSCILIDYLNINPEIFKLINNNIASLYILNIVAKEVKNNNFIELVENNIIKIILPDADILKEALNYSDKVSFQDRSSMLTAERYSYAFVTNDKRLRKLCVQKEIKIFWGFDLLKILIEAKLITKQHAVEIAKKIQMNNRNFITKDIINKFIQDIK
jgi:predicted nucleic acid-binding protein